LNDVYQPMRSNMLARDPFPDVKVKGAFNVVSMEESHIGFPLVSYLVVKFNLLLLYEEGFLESERERGRGVKEKPHGSGNDSAKEIDRRNKVMSSTPNMDMIMENMLN
ncbi:hypothetical protein Tco_0644588, partial [Tanacetum coccineum]